MAGDGDDGWWKKLIDGASPTALRGMGGLAICIEATRWMPDDLAGNLETYADYGLFSGGAVCLATLLYGVITSK